MRTFTRKSMVIILLFILMGLTHTTVSLHAQTNRYISEFEPEIAAFEASDRTNPPPQGAILFVGSSSFRKWKTLAQDFPGKQIINRGFGGSTVGDSIRFAERIVFPYHPRLIVFYAGDNDLKTGKSPDEVVADYRAFVETVHAHLPKTRIAYLSIKPSPSRWNLNDKMVTVNAKIKAFADPQLEFIDIYPLVLGADGKPKPELFLEDGLHPSGKCYAMWTAVIKPFLD